MTTPKRTDIDGKYLCTSCQLWLDPDAFSRRPERPSGLRSKCKSCSAASAQIYRQKNPQRVAASRELARTAHPESGRKYTADYRARHPEKEAAQRRKQIQDRKANPEKYRERERELYKARRAEILVRKAAWRAANPEKAKLYSARKRAENPERTRELAAAVQRRRRATPRGKLENSIRAAIYAELIPGSKRGRKTFALLGYSLEDLREHLERQFQPGMSWENYGINGWHIDHRLPLASFSYQTPDDPGFKAAWSLSNLSPLWAEENRSKGAKRLLLI